MKQQKIEVDSIVLTFYITIFGLICATTALFASDRTPLPYTQELWGELILMSLMSMITKIFSTLMCYELKVSDMKLVMNLQLVIVIAFDVMVMDATFTKMEVAGCACMILANLSLLLK